MSKIFFKVIFYLMMLTAVSTLYADNTSNGTCPLGAEQVSLGTVSGSVTDKSDRWDYYKIQPGAGTLTLSNYTSTRNTNVYFSKNSCASNQIVNRSTSTSSHSLTLSASDTVYIAIEEHTNRRRSCDYSFTLSFVAAVNHPPVAQNQSVTVPQGTATPITLVATDSDGDPLTYTVDTQPAHGSLSGTAPNLTYTPAVGYTGSDSFTFHANDGTSDSNIATVSITVSPYTQPTSFNCANPKTFSIVYQTNDFGDIAQIGNSNLCMDDGHGHCTDPGNRTNNDIKMINFNYDTSGTTTNSSMAVLSLPAGATVLYAGLLWQGYFAGNYNDTQKAAGKTIKFKYDGQTYNTLTADDMNWVYFSNTRMYYQSYKDVTNYVKQYKGGRYVAADIATTLGQPQGGSYGAWSLSVAYRDENGKFKNLTFYRGYQALAGNSDISNAITYARDHGCDTGNTGVGNDTGAVLTGFITPKSGKVDARLTVFTGEGDIGLTGDTVSVTDVNNTAHDLWNGINPQNNVMNATISFNGALVTSGSPNYRNSLGIDIDTYDISSYISNQQSSTTVDFHTNGDGYMPGFFAFSADLHVPNICYDYSYEQLGRYFTEDNNGSEQPRITGNIVPNEPITVGIYFRNNEQSDIKASNNKLSVYDIGMTPSITYATGSTEVTYAGTSNPVPATPAGQSLHSFSDLGLGDIGGQQYVYAYYKIDPHDNSYIDIPLNADINYTLNLLDLHGNSIPLSYVAELGSGKVPLCRGAGGGTGYEPVYGNFNAENPNLFSDQKYNLYTQVSGRPWDTDIVSYSSGTKGDFNDRNATVSWVKVELIDAGAYHDPQASCTEADSNITAPVPFYFSSTLNEWGDGNESIDFNSVLNSQGINKAAYYNVAVERAAYRIWYLVNPYDGKMLQPVCSAQTPLWTFFGTPEGKALLQDTKCKSECNAAASACDTPNGNNSGKNLDGCLECLYPHIAVPVCSRDDFAIRPESFVTTLIDDNTSVTRTIALSKSPTYTGTQIKLAAGYPYRFDINATSHATNLYGDAGVRGYINDFGSFNLATNRAYMSWTPTAISIGQAALNCNEPVDQNMTFHLQDGTTYNPAFSWMTPKHSTITNVGEYTYMVKDSQWTRTDFNATDLSHHTGPYFLPGTDCKVNSSVVPATGVSGGVITDNGIQSTDPVIGCDISSVHTNADTHVNYVALNIRTYPYDINVSLIKDQDEAKPFYYMNNVANNALTTNLPADANESVHLYGQLKPEGKDHSSLTNFVNGCYAEPVAFSYTPSVSSVNGHLLRWREMNSSTDTNSTVLPVIIDPSVSSNAFLKADKGLTTLDLHINYDRDRTNAVNPVDLNISAIAADCADSASSPNCQTNTDGVTNHNAIDSNNSFVSKHLILYGRIHAPRYVVDQTNGSLPVYFEFYYDRGNGVDTNTSLTTLSNDANRSRDAIYWYINTQHQTLNDGNITNAYRFPSIDSYLTLTPDVTGSVDTQNLNYTYTGNSFPYRSTIKIESQPWLIYNRYDVNTTTVEMPLEINGDQNDTAGHEDLNNADSGDSTNRPRRIRW